MEENQFPNSAGILGDFVLPGIFLSVVGKGVPQGNGFVTHKPFVSTRKVLCAP